MKKIIAFGLFGLLLSCHQQTGIVTGSPLPAFDMLQRDSTILKSGDLPSGQYTIFLYFRPDCIHCQKETYDLVKNARVLSGVQLVFLTPSPLADLRRFAAFYKLDSFANFKMVSDNKFGFLHYFNPPGVPFVVIYDKEKKFKDAYAGGVSIDTLKQSLNL